MATDQIFNNYGVNLGENEYAYADMNLGKNSQAVEDFFYDDVAPVNITSIPTLQNMVIEEAAAEKTCKFLLPVVPQTTLYTGYN